MAEKKVRASSRYALKAAGSIVTESNTRPRRVGDCGHTLAGRRGHGFVGRGGKMVVCGDEHCMKKAGLR